MKLRDAVIQVLHEAGEPLHVDKITEIILGKGLLKTKSKTPNIIISASLYSDIKRNGEASPFIKHSPQTFGLRGTVSLEAKNIKDTDFQTKDTESKKYKFLDSAEKVLEEFGNKQPMHYKEITEKALNMGWLTTKGKTPEVTMLAQILTEIKYRLRRGEQPRFVRYGKGLVGLSKWMGVGLAYEIQQHNKKVRQKLHKRLLDMDWDKFEELIARLLAEMGFEDIEVTSPIKDGGIDVRGTLVIGDVIRTRMAIQVKKWKPNVQAPIVQQVRGSLEANEQGLIITTSDFSSGAIKEAKRPGRIPVALMSGEQLVLLLIENGIGISRRIHEIFDLDELSDID